VCDPTRDARIAVVERAIFARCGVVSQSMAQAATVIA
jgi:hypothetical protein